MRSGASAVLYALRCAVRCMYIRTVPASILSFRSNTRLCRPSQPEYRWEQLSDADCLRMTVRLSGRRLGATMTASHRRHLQAPSPPGGALSASCPARRRGFPARAARRAARLLRPLMTRKGPLNRTQKETERPPRVCPRRRCLPWAAGRGNFAGRGLCWCIGVSLDLWADETCRAAEPERRRSYGARDRRNGRSDCRNGAQHMTRDPVQFPENQACPCQP